MDNKKIPETIFEKYIFPDLSEKLTQLKSNDFKPTEANKYIAYMDISDKVKAKLAELISTMDNELSEKDFKDYKYLLHYEYNKEDDIGCGLKCSGGYYDIGLYSEGNDKDEEKKFQYILSDISDKYLLDLNDNVIWGNDGFMNLMMNSILKDLGYYESDKEHFLMEQEAVER